MNHLHLSIVFTGMIRCFLILLLFSACTKKQTSAVVATNSVVATNPPAGTAPLKTFLALGDSYTIGEGVTSSNRFPAQTIEWLRLNGVQFSALDYIAATGWITTALQNNINSLNPAPHDVVTLLIGVNDQYQQRDTTGYRQRFTTLLQRAIQLARDKKQNVFVLSIPDYSVTPFAVNTDTARIRTELGWFNAINKQITDSYQITYLDITPSTRLALTDRSLLATDGLHPSGLEYKKWAERLGPLMLPVLK
jgi:lysophospholipase L1-like esterase